MQSWGLAVVMGIIALLGLVMASQAGDAVFYGTGLALFAFSLWDVDRRPGGLWAPGAHHPPPRRRAARLPCFGSATARTTMSCEAL